MTTTIIIIEEIEDFLVTCSNFKILAFNHLD
jgi:hypothetical protein